MTFNVNKFISHFDSHAGFSKTSKFDVLIPVPSFLQSLGTTEELSLQCESAELPGYTLNTVESKIFGAPTSVAGTPAFGDITLSFLCAGDLWEKKFFDAWVDYIIPKQTYLVKYKQKYVTDITIRQFSEGDPNYQPSPNNPNQPEPKVIYSCKLLNAFPATVNALNLNWGTDDIHRLTVALKFDRWLPVDAEQPLSQAPVRSVPGVSDSQKAGQSIGSVIGSPSGSFRVQPTSGSAEILKSTTSTATIPQFGGSI